MVATFRMHVRVFPIAMWAVAALAAVTAVLVWAAFARTLSHATPVPVAAVPRTNAVVWRHRVYQSRTTLARDIARTGGSYTTWAHNHPAAADLLVSLGRSRTGPPLASR
jgi:hypothetical protein